MGKNQRQKTLGQFTTPEYLSSYLIKRTLDIWLRSNSGMQALSRLHILDPACGMGIFLSQALNLLISTYQRRYAEKESLDSIKRLVIANNLYGIDIDVEAVSHTQANIAAGYNGNLKVFDALNPPPRYKKEAPIRPRLVELRKSYKNLFISQSKRQRQQTIATNISQLETAVSKQILKDITTDFGPGHYLLPPMSWEAVFPETGGKFSIILGNPPWGGILPYPPQLIQLYHSGMKQVDTWSLFLERCILALEDQGLLGFILPNTLLLNENYSTTRQIILNHCLILEIINLGDGIFSGVTQPCLLIILQKKPAQSLDMSPPIKIVNGIPQNTKTLLQTGDISLLDLPYITCYQTQFQNNPNSQFDIFSIGYESFIQLMEGDIHISQYYVRPLKDLVINGRGVEINRRGKVVRCPSCGLWNSPITKRTETTHKGLRMKKCAHCGAEITELEQMSEIVHESPQPNTRSFLAGRDIHRYLIHSPRYLDITRQGIKYKDPALYEGKKLLLRKTGNTINIALDDQNHWVSQVVYVFKIRNQVPVSIEFLLGVLNSKLMRHYYYHKYGDLNRQDFPHFTQRKFLQLPIKIPHSIKEKNMAREIGSLASSLQVMFQQDNSQKDFSPPPLKLRERTQTQDATLDDLICTFYEIPNSCF